MTTFLVSLLFGCVVSLIFVFVDMDREQKSKYMLVAGNQIKFFSSYREVKLYISLSCNEDYALFVKDRGEYVCVTKNIVE